MKRKQLTEVEIKELVEKEDYEFVKLEKINRVKYLFIKHRLCGKEYRIRLDKFISGQRCSCLRKREESLIKSTEDFQKFLNTKFGENEYIAVSEYLGRKKPIRIRHSCGFEYEIKRAEFLLEDSGGKCPVCFLANKMTREILEERIKRKGLKVSIKAFYDKDNVLIENECGHQYLERSSILLSGDEYRCHVCGKFSKHIDIERVRKEINSEEYTLLSEEYKGTHKKLMVRHNVCGHTYEVSRANFLIGKRCPYCRHSKGEDEIERFLLKNHIDFEREKSFDDLIYESKLKFDFFIPERNLLIEYDGLFHYEDKFGELEIQKKRDQTKNEWVDSHPEFSLLRIPYWDQSKIPEILSKVLQ